MLQFQRRLKTKIRYIYRDKKINESKFLFYKNNNLKGLYWKNKRNCSQINQLKIYKCYTERGVRAWEEKMGAEDESIEQAVASRRERLLALRAAQQLSNASEPEPNNQDEQPPPTSSEDDEEKEYVFKFFSSEFL